MQIMSQFNYTPTNKVQLPEKWIKFLVTQGESGMGYQNVVVTLADGRATEGFVSNAEWLETVLPISTEDIADIKMR